MKKGSPHPSKVRECVDKLSKRYDISTEVCLRILSRDFPNIKSKYQQNADLISIMPDEMKLEVALKMPLKTLLAMATTSRDWKDFLSDQALWKELYQRDYGKPPSGTDDYKALYKERALIDAPSKRWLAAVYTGSTTEMPEIPSFKKFSHIWIRLHPPGVRLNELILKRKDEVIYPVAIIPLYVKYRRNQLYSTRTGEKILYMAVPFHKVRNYREQQSTDIIKISKRKMKTSALEVKRALADRAARDMTDEKKDTWVVADVFPVKPSK
jgi:hypothetical protein